MPEELRADVAVTAQGAEGFSFPFEQESYSMTYDAIYKGHNISDDQLKMLHRAASDTPEVIGWSQALMGTSIGTLQNVISVFATMYKGTSVTIIDFLGALVCVGTGTAAAALWYSQRKKKRDIDTLVETIRNRPVIKLPIRQQR